MVFSVRPIRWGVVLDGVAIGEVWEAGGELQACAFVGGMRYPVPLSHGERRFPENAAGAVHAWLATARVYDPQLHRAATRDELQAVERGEER